MGEDSNAKVGRLWLTASLKQGPQKSFSNLPLDKFYKPAQKFHIYTKV